MLDLIVANVRTPTERHGDLTAQLAAHRVAERRTGDIAARYGLERIISISQELIDYSSRLARARIARLPRGTYEFVDYLDDDGISPNRCRSGYAWKLTRMECGSTLPGPARRSPGR